MYHRNNRYHVVRLRIGADDYWPLNPLTTRHFGFRSVQHMIRRIAPALIIMAVLAITATPSAPAATGPDLTISTRRAGWVNRALLRSRTASRWLYLRLENQEPDSATFTFSGPTGNADWDLTYYKSGMEVTNTFQITMEGQTSTVIKVKVTQIGPPDSFFWATESNSNAFTLAGSASQDTAEAVVLVPGDLWVRERHDDTWTGEDRVLAPATDIWQCSQTAGTQLASARDTAVYFIRLQNVNNATVSYRIKARRKTGSGASIAYYYYVDRTDWISIEEVTEEITSSSGWVTGYLGPGESRFLAVQDIPVGSQQTTRQIAVSASVDDVDGLQDLDLDNLIPIVVRLEDLPGVGEDFSVYGPPDADTLSPGVFGLMDFDGGANPIKDLSDWLLNSYTVDVADDLEYVWLDGTPGFRSSLAPEMEEIVARDETVHIPVCDMVTDQGNTTQCRVRGYAAVKITSWNDGDARATFHYTGFFTMPALEEAVLCNTALDAALAIENWREVH